MPDLDYITLINPVFTDVAFHILISFILALIVNVRLRHKYWLYLMAAIAINFFIDGDHFLAPFFNNVGIFHNMFVFVIIPLAIYGIAFIYGQKKRKGVYPAIALMFFAITLSHLFIDAADGSPIFLQFPLSTTKFIFNPAISIKTSFFALRTQECALLLLGILALAFNRIAAYHQHSTLLENSEPRRLYSLRKVMDRGMAQILILLRIREMAPHEITAFTGIPLAEVYRRIHILVHLGIVEVKGIRYIRGRKIQFYGVVPGRVYIKNGEIYIFPTP